MRYIKEILATVIRFLMSLVRRIFDREPPSDPDRTLAAIVAAAESRRVEWPNKIRAIYPSVYTVSLSSADWAFYGATQEVSQRNFTELLRAHIERRGGEAPNLRVVLQPSKSRFGGPRVEMRYQDDRSRELSHGSVFDRDAKGSSQRTVRRPPDEDEAVRATSREGVSGDEGRTHRGGAARAAAIHEAVVGAAPAADAATDSAAAADAKPEVTGPDADERVAPESEAVEGGAPGQASEGAEETTCMASGTQSDPACGEGGTIRMDRVHASVFDAPRDLGGLEPTATRPLLVGDALGTVVSVQNHAAIGVPRPGDALPSIELPDNDAFHRVGACQGVFDRDPAGSWYFICLERSGAMVERPGDRYRELGRGEALELHHGDILVMPAGAPIAQGIRFLCRPEGAVESR